MIHNVFIKTGENLRLLALTHRACVISYSGGKDSLAVLDLCSKTFEKIICFYMYLVPGLECIEWQLDYARTRYGVSILQYPHWILMRNMHAGIYFPNHYKYDNLPLLELKDIYKIVQQDTGINLIATGAKSGDSLWRKYNLHNADKKYKNVIFPIVEWNKFDVLAYLKMHNIPIPDTSAGNATGIDLTSVSLLWLHDTYPEDFKKLCNYFPYAEAVVWRRTFYGIK